MLGLLRPSTLVQEGVKVLQCLLYMPKAKFAWRTAESTATVQNLGKSLGICSKHCNYL